MKNPRLPAGLLSALAALGSLGAAPAPHPDRPDRLVETRDGFSVEYSPGQEAWMEMGFAEMAAQAARTSALPPPAPARGPGPAVPGSAQYLQENREVILAAVARQIGLERPTPLQGRVFDTFLGYYKITSELMGSFGRELPDVLTPHHLAIWQRDDLIRRLRTGAKIEGLSYDPATDSGMFSFALNTNSTRLGDRLAEIRAEIDAQQVRHEFNSSEGTYHASFTLGQGPARTKKTADQTPAAAPEDIATVLARLVVPVIYRGDPASAPEVKEFAYIQQALDGGRTQIAKQSLEYRDPTMMAIILHETAESGLLENIINSRDRRWLCDGTANYVAWRVARDLLGPDFAAQIYPLDARLRQYAALQPKINLTAWSAVEKQKPGEAETELNRAHYVFATRAMFLLAEKHGEDALARLWADVAKTPMKKVTAKTFAEAYRKRYKGDLGKLLAETQQKPIPAAPSATPTP